MSINLSGASGSVVLRASGGGGVGPTGPTGPQGSAGATGATGPAGASASGGTSVGTFASRPAAGTAGRIYIATDSPIAQWVDDGSAWRPLIQGQALGTQVPAASAFTKFNDGSNTLTLSDNAGALQVVSTATGGGAVHYGATVSLTSATAYVQGCIAMGAPSTTRGTLGIVGLCMRSSSNGNAAAIQLVEFYDGGTKEAYIEGAYIANNSWSSTPFKAPTMPNAPLFFRVARVGSNVKAYTSMDGVNWQEVFSAATATAFGGATPDQVGINIMKDGAAFANVLSFSYGSL